METYHKIQTVYKRDPETKFKTLLEGQFSLPEFEYLKDTVWCWDEKIDGTNIRVQWHSLEGQGEVADIVGNELTFKGKTDTSGMYPGLEKALNNLFMPKIETFRKLFGEKAVCFYGEGYGPKIQKVGGLYRATPGFILFDVLIGYTWLRREDVKKVAEELEVDVVPSVGRGNLRTMVEVTRDGFNSAFGNFTAEGIVARPEIELCDRMGRRIITKIKHKDFK